MIAIAGAKGGCGKTVCTLGLAEAFAREDRPAVAVDADRQLPNLHVVGGVEQEPTLGAIQEDVPISDILKESPRTGDAGIIPAPDPSDPLDFESTLGHLAAEDVRVVIDCPSGAGPDVVEAMSAADRIVVVTTEDERSIEGAHTTIDLAERLQVPVEGILVTKCRGVPEAIDEAFDLPVLATVPEVDAPLTDEWARQAFDSAAAHLGEFELTRPSPVHGEFDTNQRLSVGIPALNRELNGGLPPGSVIALNADPNSQSENLLYELTTERGTLYLTTERSEELVRNDIDTAVADSGNPTIRHINGPAPTKQALEYVRLLPDGANLVIDTMDTLERVDREIYLDFLNELIAEVRASGSIAMVHCLNGSSVPANRPSTEHFADAVFDLQTTVEGSTVEQHLSIPKSRNERAPNEAIELDLTTGPTIGIEPVDEDGLETVNPESHR